MPEWLELELAEALRPVAAPPELRFGGLEFQPEHGRSIWSAWPIAALATLALAAGLLCIVAKGRVSSPGFQQLAIQQLHDGAPLDVLSGDPAEVRLWLRREAGIDLAVPAGGTARLLGARVIRNSGTKMVAVVYRAGDRDATFLVAAAGLPGDLPRAEAACLVCHTSL